MRLLALFLLLCVRSWSVIGVSEPVAQVASTSNTTSYSLVAFTPSANAILTVFVFASDTTAVATMTGGGFSWTLETSVLYNTVNTAYLFWAKTGSSPGSTTVTFDCTGDTASGAIIAISEWTGADVSTPNPIKQFKTAATTAANPTATFDANMTTTNGYAGGVGLPLSGANVCAQPTLWTEIADTGYGTPTAAACVAHRALGETGATVTFTASSAAYGIIIAEVYESGAGPGGPAGPPTGSLALMGVGK